MKMKKRCNPTECQTETKETKKKIKPKRKNELSKIKNQMLKKNVAEETSNKCKLNKSSTKRMLFFKRT